MDSGAGFRYARRRLSDYADWCPGAFPV